MPIKEFTSQYKTFKVKKITIGGKEFTEIKYRKITRDYDKELAS